MNLSDDEVRSIQELYKAQISIPSKEHNTHKQFFLCPIGLVGAGKSTVIKPLTIKFSLVRISSDEVRKILKEKGLDYERTMDIVKPLAEEFAGEGYSIAFDADCGSPSTKKIIETIAVETGAKILWIHINPPEEFILHKLRTYKHTWLFKDADQAIENYFQQKKRRIEENTQFSFLTSVDTSSQELAKVIEQVAALITKNISYS